MPGLLHRLPRNVLTIFSGRNLAWHALAIALTILLLESGFDWTWYLWTRSEILPRLARPAIILGGLIPILGIPSILLAGWVTRNRPIRTGGWALGQAALLGWFISSGYKAFTGRIHPPLPVPFQVTALSHAPLVDTSHSFQLGFLRGGIFWGWPSGHTTVAFAVTTCLIALWSGHKPWCYLLLLYPFYVGLAVSVTIHWFSEFVAGAIIGSVIGIVVGKSYTTPSSPA